MTRRKLEITGHMNERDFPHIVELELPPGGFRSQGLEFDAFHRERGIPIRRGRGRQEAEQFPDRFCFRHRGCLPEALRRYSLDLFTLQARAPLRLESAVSVLLLAARRRRQSHDAGGSATVAQIYARYRAY